jgi:hypothetical protein
MHYKDFLDKQLKERSNLQREQERVNKDVDQVFMARGNSGHQSALNISQSNGGVN